MPIKLQPRGNLSTASLPMNNYSPLTSGFGLHAWAKLLLSLCVLSELVARAGLTVDIHTYRYPDYFVTYGWLSTNTTPPAAPLGFYTISSPNGSHLRYELDGTGLNYITGGGTGTSDFNSYMSALTNGQWSIQVTNSSSTNTYYFSVAATGLNSNLFNAPTITFPTNTAQGVNSDPTFTWAGGPVGWLGTCQPTVRDLNFSYYEYQDLTGAVLSWTTPNPPLPLGTNVFSLVYLSNATASIVASVPLDLGNNPIAGWVSTANLDVNAYQVEFVVGQANPFDAYLVARYDFENTNSPGRDTSGNDNDANCSSSGGPQHDIPSSDAAIHNWAREYFGYTSICFTDGGSAFPNLSNALAGSFTVTAWVKTTASAGFDNSDAENGLPVLTADNQNENSTTPLSITGDKAAFTVRDVNGDPVTIHSTNTVNNGGYHFLAVTRNHTNGAMRLYVDGILEGSDTGATGVLSVGTYLSLAGGNYNYEGLIDDVRIYGTELSAGNIATLYGGEAIALGDAVDAPNLVWTTGGTTNWFGQTAITHDNLDAARSGAIGDDGDSWIETSLVGPGTLNFWWRVSSDDNNGYDWLLLEVDGDYYDEIAGDSGWNQYEIQFGPGSHTVRWTYFKDASGVANLDAAFLDEVSFTTANAPQITQHPFSQTNYPGYQVALIAEANATPAPTWQWYKSGVLIPGATSTFYSPTNSGTAGVAGNYHAVASNASGSANTHTAVVSFVSAPLPPDWSVGVSAPIYNSFDQVVTNYGIACLEDAAGNVYSANSFTGTNSVGTNEFAAGSGRFATVLMKLNSTGSLIWGRSMTNSGNGNSYPQCLATAPGNGVYMSGVFIGTNGLGTNQLTEIGGSTTYLARFDSAGNILWVRTIGGTNACFQGYHQLVSDPAGNVTISALGENYTSVSGVTNLLLNGQRGVLAQFDANGALRWVSQPSSWCQNLAYGNGRIYAAMGGAETNYAGGLTNTSDRHWALVALNADNGQAIWLRNFGPAIGNGVFADTPRIAVAGSNVFLAGSGGGGSASFGGFSVTWPSTGQYLAGYDTNGNARFATNFGSTTTMPWVAAADAAGNVYVGGDFDGYSMFGSRVIAGPHVNALAPGFFSQSFLAKFDRNGVHQWTRTAQSPYLASLRDISLASDGVWGVGFTDDRASLGAFTVSGPAICIGFPFCFIQNLTGGWIGKITESSGGSSPLPVTLVNLEYPANNFRFSFASQSGFNHLVLYRTNLTVGTWLTNSTVPGDGSVKTVNVPLSLFGGAKQGFVRVLTQ